MKKPIILLALFIYLAPITQAQNTEKDLSKYSYAELDSLMAIYYYDGMYSNCIPYMAEGLKRAELEFGREDSMYVEYLERLGFSYYHAGENEKAETLYLKGIEVSKQFLGTFSSQYSTLLNDLATLFQDQSKLEECEAFYLEAKEIREKLFGNMDKDYAEVVNNLAFLYNSMGKYEEALSLFLESSNIIKETLGTSHGYYAGSLNNLGGIYQDLEDYSNAEKYYKECLIAIAGIFGKDHPYYGQTLNNLATMSSEQGDYKTAEELHIKSMNITKRTIGEFTPMYATSLNSLGNLKSKMGEFEASKSLLLKASSIIRSTLSESHPDYVTSLINLASLYKAMGSLDTAFAYCIKSLVINSTNFDKLFPQLFSKNKENLSIIHEPNLDYQELSATDILKLSELNYRHSIELNGTFLELLDITQKAYQKKSSNKDTKEYQSQLKLHYNIGKTAIKLNERIRDDFSARSNKLRILGNNSSFVRYGIDAASRISEQEYLSEAFSFAEQNKSILLADAAKGNRARNLGDLPDSLALLEIELQKRKEDLKKYKFEAQTEEEIKNIITEENGLNEEIDNFLKSLKNKYPKYHALKYENITANTEDIQNLLDQKTLLLEYFVADSVTYLFVVTKNKVELFPINISKTKLKNKIQKLRYNLTNYRSLVKNKMNAYNSYTKIAHWFYKNILELGIKGKNVDNLIIIADGELGHLPFESFLVEKAVAQKMEYSNLHYLVKDYNISYNYSATLWKENLTSNNSLNSNNNGQMLACASAYPIVDSSLLNLRQAHIYKLRTLLNPLPAAQNEVSGLQEFFQGDFQQNNATNERFFKENAHKYGVIHLAMHGILHPRLPMLSSLAFTENKDSIEDNFLQAYEISRLKLNANLVVLSACETGYGKFKQGEGVISLARSFMYAGVPSLVVSLWQVNDASTAAIMKYFYNNLAKGMNKDAALRVAKLNYLKNVKGIVAHPAFWSPFIQLGDNRPIELSKKGSPWIWWILGCFTIFLGGFFFFRKKG